MTIRGVYRTPKGVTIYIRGGGGGGVFSFKKGTGLRYASRMTFELPVARKSLKLATTLGFIASPGFKSEGKSLVFFNIFKKMCFSSLISSFSICVVYPSSFWVNLGPFWVPFWTLKTPPPLSCLPWTLRLGLLITKPILEPFLAPTWLALEPFGKPFGSLWGHFHDTF